MTTYKNSLLEPNNIEEEEKEIEKLEAHNRGEEINEDSDEEKNKKEEGENTDAKDPTVEAIEKQEDATWQKRYGDLRRHLQKKEGEWQKQLDDLTKKVEQGSEVTLPKTEEDLKQFMEDYPDLAAVIRTMAIKEASSTSEAISERLEKVEELEKQVNREKVLNQVRKTHSDLDEIAQSNEFYNWVVEKGDWVEKAVYGDNQSAQPVIDALTLYKTEKGLTSSKSKSKSRSNDADAAADVNVRGGAKPSDDVDNANQKIWTESEISQLSDEEFIELEDELQKAAREGRIRK